MNGFTCSCLLGYTGIRCEQDINECSPSPCLQGAQCLNLVGQFECICPVGFEGILHCKKLGTKLFCENELTNKYEKYLSVLKPCFIKCFHSFLIYVNKFQTH